jgi:hypothetical protein
MAKPVDTLVNLSPVGLVYRGITGSDLANTQQMFDPPQPPPVASPDKNPLPKAPGVDDADTKARMAQAEAIDRQRRKRSATILTGAKGVLEQAPVQLKQLFGS